ncbi:ABC transporter permease [Bacillus horti]|uniref:ABC-2 type transport system permease protein n=1 Tax=Caldalkalibacillus horti TaxID=77523 RepID=A0ABT9W570_9BACI|nr:ABC transporter permease [Bacillus horti]MDQ0168275.1 ABC-2 type transport system permease protein [Bacillus horti]
MLGTIFRSMLVTSIKDKITLFYSLLLPVLLIIGLGLYMDVAYHQTLLFGTLAISTLFWGLSGIAFQVHQQRSQGVYKLIRLTPFPTFAFILIVAGSRTVLGILINITVYVFGALFLKQAFSLSGIVGLLLVLAIGTLCFSCLGFFISNVSKNEGQISMFSNLLFIPIIFASEVFYSLQGAPQWIYVIGQLFPMNSFMQSLYQSQYGLGMLAPLGLLMIFTCIWAVLALLTFRWDDRTYLFISMIKGRKQTL